VRSVRRSLTLTKSSLSPEILGGKRTLIITPARGNGASAVMFDVELLGVN
jgi:hypothetical protein